MARTIWRKMGPGLLWAGAAIGVSHLVQSTRAGAIYGFELVGLLLLVNLLKYPFFEFGPRYASATGESLIAGYRRSGKWSVWLYFFLTIATMFTIQSAVTLVTAGLFSSVFGMSSFTWVIIILAVSLAIVGVGKYKALDKSIKLIIVLLAVSTVVAVFLAAGKGFNPDPELSNHFQWRFEDMALLIAFAGWMPSAIDISVWHSMWSLAKNKSQKEKTTVKDALFDFNVGYFGTVILSIGFLSLGALVMYGTGEHFSSNGTEFAGQFIYLFTSSLGKWSYPVIATAALTTMFSTTITCLDAYPRVLKETTLTLAPKFRQLKKTDWIPVVWMIILLGGTLLLISAFINVMSRLVDLATTLSFLTAPVLGYLNFKAVTGEVVPQSHRPKPWLRILSWTSLAILTAVSVYYIIWKFFLI